VNTAPPGSGHRGGGFHPDEPGPFEPGLDHLVRALTAGGHPDERAGRDAALAAFRAASQQPRRTGLAAAFRAPRGTVSPPRRRPRLLVSARLAAVAAAGFAAVVGLTAAAYAKALPAPVQNIAYSVLAPLGVPNSHPQADRTGRAGKTGSTGAASSRSPVPSTAAASSGANSPGGTGPSPASPSPTASTLGGGHYAITVTAGRPQVQADTSDLFTAKVSDRGRPASGVRIRLLKQVAGSSRWRLVASGVTGGRGRVRLRTPVLTASATFRLAGPGGASSAPITVTVTPVVRLRLVSGPNKDRLIVTAPGAAAGQIVRLMALDNGTWKAVSSEPLGPKLRAVFTLPAGPAAGYFYRAELPGPAVASPTTSNRVWVPRRAGTGAQVIRPSQSPTPGPAASAVATSSPAPAASPTLTPTPQPTSSASEAPITGPTPTPTIAPTATPEPTTTPYS